MTIVAGITTLTDGNTRSTIYCSGCNRNFDGASYGGRYAGGAAWRDAERLKAKHADWHHDQEAAEADPFAGITG